MKIRIVSVAVTLLCLVTEVAQAQLPKAKAFDPSPWNGSWRLNVQRSSPVGAQKGVPQVYRFTLGPGPSADVPIKWEIPELGEVVTGRTNDMPMPITRTEPTPGLKLAVRTSGAAFLLYSVFRDGKLIGGGRMMLVDNGSAWVDLTWPEDREDLASALVYVKE